MTNQSSHNRDKQNLGKTGVFSVKAEKTSLATKEPFFIQRTLEEPILLSLELELYTAEKFQVALGRNFFLDKCFTV